MKIHGKDSLETSIIDSLNYKKTFIDYKSLAIEVDSLYIKLQKIGYLETELKALAKKNDSTYLANFNLNNRYNALYIYYDSTLISEAVLRAISKTVTPDYFIIKIKDSETVLNYLSATIIEDGLPFASLSLNNITIKDSYNLQAKLQINSNRKRNVNSIVIKGYEKFSKSYIKHFLRIKKDDIFNLNEITQKTNNLNTLRFANQTKPPEVLFTKDSTSVYLYLEKSKSNTFDGFLGFGTNETTNRLEFDGYLDLNLVNNLNYGESVALKYKSDENNQVTFEAKFNLPYLFGSPIGTELSLNIFRRDSIFNTVNQSASVFYQISPNQKIYAGLNTTQSTNLLDNSTDQNLQDFNTINYNLQYEYIKPQFNSFLFPLNFLFNLKGGFGTRDFNDISESQSAFSLKSFKIFNLNLKNSFYLNVDGGSIISENYLTNELLRFGGINSIRGFEENTIIANLYGVANTEYRYQLSQSIYIHSIIDLAYFEDDISNIKEKLFGFGFGFGIITKAGLLKFNYANGRRDNQDFRFSDSKIHLSLNATF